MQIDFSEEIAGLLDAIKKEKAGKQNACVHYVQNVIAPKIGVEGAIAVKKFFGLKPGRQSSYMDVVDAMRKYGKPAPEYDDEPAETPAFKEDAPAGKTLTARLSILEEQNKNLQARLKILEERLDKLERLGKTNPLEERLDKLERVVGI